MERASDKVTYRCRLCRQHLFDSSCVMNAVQHEEPADRDDASSTISPSSSASSPVSGVQLPSLAVERTGLHSNNSGTGSAPGPSSVWFISEDATPPWVQKTVEKFKWKKGKLSCPKCRGRLGSFDFVTPHKSHCGSRKASCIQVMMSRVDCESSSPIIARIRPMPQIPVPTGSSHAQPADERAAAEAGSAINRALLECEDDGYEMNEVAGVLPTNSAMPSTSSGDSHLGHGLTDGYVSLLEEDSVHSQRNIHRNERTASFPEAGTQSYNDNLSVRNQLGPDVTLRHQQNSLYRTSRCVPQGARLLPNEASRMHSGLNRARHRTHKSQVPVDSPVSFGLEQRRENFDSQANNSTPEPNLAYVSGTSRSREAVSETIPNPGVSSIPSQPSSSSNNGDWYGREDSRRNRRQSWRYGDIYDEQEEEEEEERWRYSPNHSTSSGNTGQNARHSRHPDISSNIFRSGDGFFRPFFDNSFLTDGRLGLGSASNSSSHGANLYSQLPTAEQAGGRSVTQRDVRSSRGGLSTTGGESEEEEEPAVFDTGRDRNDNISGTRQRNAGEQRKERNRKKKERRKQRRYEKWLERQTLGEEEESAMQDISAAGLYSLLGPRCAGSSLREVTTCSVCLDIYYQPHLCYPCEHIFCEPCLRQVARFHQVVTPCPLCRTTIKSVKLHDQLTSAVKQLFPRQFENRHQMERRTINRSFPLPGIKGPPWHHLGSVGYQNRSHVDFLASRRNAGYVHDWGRRYLQGVLWRVVASTAVLMVVSGVSLGFLHFLFGLFSKSS